MRNKKSAIARWRPGKSWAKNTTFHELRCVFHVPGLWPTGLKWWWRPQRFASALLVKPSILKTDPTKDQQPQPKPMENHPKPNETPINQTVNSWMFSTSAVVEATKVRPRCLAHFWLFCLPSSTRSLLWLLHARLKNLRKQRGTRQSKNTLSYKPPLRTHQISISSKQQQRECLSLSLVGTLL